MQSHITVFVAIFFFALGTLTAPVDDATVVDHPSYGPAEEAPYDGNVWPRSISQPVQDFLSHHFHHIDDSSGTDENANDRSKSPFQQGSDDLTTFRLRYLCQPLYL